MQIINAYTRNITLKMLSHKITLKSFELLSCRSTVMQGTHNDVRLANHFDISITIMHQIIFM